MLVEDAVVREEVLSIDALDAAIRADGAGVREISVEPRGSDECDDPLCSPCDLLERVVRRPDESGAEQEVLGRIPGRRELGTDDEVCAYVACVGECGDDLGAVPVEVADDEVELRQSESQGFRLTVTN